VGSAVVVPIGEARSRRAAGAPPAVDPADVARRVAAGERLYTAAELGRLLGGRSARSIARDVQQGMPWVAVGAVYRRFILADVLAWQRNRREAGDQHEGSAA
jgi:hypothetical protein